MSTSSIQPIDRTLSGATILRRSGPGGNVNEGLLHIPKISKQSDGISKTLVEGGFTTPRVQLVYSTAQTNWAG